MLTILLAASLQATSISTASEVASIAQPYLACRRYIDRGIVVIRQSIQEEVYKSSNYDVRSHPNYNKLRDAMERAETECDLPKYVAIVLKSVQFSPSYDDYQKRTLAKFIIEDAVSAQWTLLSAQEGTYRFPPVVVTRMGGQDK
jgi:hypothetical protein